MRHYGEPEAWVPIKGAYAAYRLGMGNLNEIDAEEMRTRGWTSDLQSLAASPLSLPRRSQRHRVKKRHFDEVDK